MEKNVKISITGKQKLEGEPATKMEFITCGKLAKYGSKYRISYQESNMFGMDGVTTTFISENGKLSMERSGKINARMEFRPGEKTDGLYTTEYGSLIMSVLALKSITTIGDDGGSITVSYKIELNREPISINTFEISVTPMLKQNDIQI